MFGVLWGQKDVGCCRGQPPVIFWMLDSLAEQQATLNLRGITDEWDYTCELDEFKGMLI